MRTNKFLSMWFMALLCAFVMAGCGDSGSTAPDTTTPTVFSVNPEDLAVNVPFNQHIAVTFSEAMDPLTVTDATFTVEGTVSVSGTVDYIGTTATFTPDGVLAADTEYTATITIGAEDLAGNALESAYVWSFTTGAMPDYIPPAVAWVDPADCDTEVPTGSTIAATFSEAMDPLTITEATFSVEQGNTPVTGTVTSADTTATFTPVNDLVRNTAYTATIAGEVKDLAGNALARDFTWAFSTAAAVVYYTIEEDTIPLFSTLIPDQAYVLKDNTNYKLYYAGNDFTSINLAQSPDGITWTPYDGNPIIADAYYHADVHYYDIKFAGANSGTDPNGQHMNYRMWYQGVNDNDISGWQYAESPDGIHWYNRMPIAQFGTPVYSVLTGTVYGIADVIYTPGASNTGTDWTFRIYANVQWEGGVYAGDQLVVMGFSDNGYDWTGFDPTMAGYATPVFAGSLDPDRFDCDHIGWFKVIKNSPTDWQAFYSGGRGTGFQALNGIGYATSDDGIHWTRRQTLFTTGDGAAWRNQSVWMPSAVKTGNSFEVFYLGSDNPDISSSDWIQWKLGRAILTPDIIAPTAISTTPDDAAMDVPVHGNISVTFSEEMDPLTITTDTFTLTQGGAPVSGTLTCIGATATFTPDTDLEYGTEYTAAITTGAADLAGHAVEDSCVWSFTTDMSLTVTVEQATGQADPTNGTTINFTVVFSEAVSDFTAGDVTLAGTAGATTAAVTGSGTTYNIEVSGMTSDGTVTAEIPAGAAADAEGNLNLASTGTDNTVTYDIQGPTVTLNQAAGQADPTNVSPINFTVVFSEAVSDFVAGDVTLTGSAGATTAAVTMTGGMDGTTYNVAVSGMTSDGTVTAEIAAGVAADAAGNPNAVFTTE